MWSSAEQTVLNNGYYEAGVVQQGAENGLTGPFTVTLGCCR